MSTTLSLKSMVQYSVKEPPAPKLSMIFMAWTFLISISPATGMPRPVNNDVPRMMEVMASSFAALPVPE